jgi:hypothetical protein
MKRFSSKVILDTLKGKKEERERERERWREREKAKGRERGIEWKPLRLE